MERKQYFSWSKTYPNIPKTDIRRLSVCYDNMIHRCYDPSDKEYKNYGKEGIRVCVSWLSNRHIFIAWALKNGYYSKLELDRIDNSLGYFPENCRFVTEREQLINQRRSVSDYINQTKICPKCKQVKSFSEFTWNKKKNIPHSHCKKCRRKEESLRRKLKNDCI